MVFHSAIIVAPNLWHSFLARLNPEDQKKETYLSVFACLVGACFIFTIVRAYGFLKICLKCAERLHDKMVVAILQALVLFFDSNPVGRILNRFSNDIGCVDEMLPKTFLAAMQMLLMIFVQNFGNSRHKCLAHISCCSNFRAGCFSIQLLPEDCQRAKEIRVDIPKPSVGSFFKEPERTGYNWYERRTDRFCGCTLQVC